MDNAPKDKFVDLIKPLLPKYLTQLAKRSDKLQAHIVVFKGQEPNVSEREELRQLAHIMAGSGTTYGFPLITEYASRIDTNINAAHAVDKQDIISDAKKLLAVCKAALQEGVPS